MLTRIITAVISLALFIPVLFFSHTVILSIAMALLSVIAAYEMLGCLGILHKYSISVPSLLICAAVPFLIRYVGMGFMLFFIVCFMLYLFFLTVLTQGGIRTEEASLAFMSITYIVTTFTSIVLLRDIKNGQYLYLLVFIGGWTTDTFAYFTGMLFGRNKLIPKISPKKTVEGAIGGIIFCILAFNVYGIIVSNISHTRPDYLVLSIAGAVVSLIAQFGDLLCSAIKRNFDKKDFGTLFPGHGGVLDRFDSVMAIAPMLLMTAELLIRFRTGGAFFIGGL